MKKQYLLICSVSLLFVCCRKNYTCECQLTLTHYNGNAFEVTTWNGGSESYDKRMTSKQAKAACDHEQQAVLASFISAYTDDGTQPMPGDDKLSSSCTLK